MKEKLTNGFGVDGRFGRAAIGRGGSTTMGAAAIVVGTWPIWMMELEKRRKIIDSWRNDVQEQLELERVVDLELERVYEEVQMREW